MKLFPTENTKYLNVLIFDVYIYSYLNSHLIRQKSGMINDDAKSVTP